VRAVTLSSRGEILDCGVDAIEVEIRDHGIEAKLLLRRGEGEEVSVKVGAAVIMYCLGPWNVGCQKVKIN
jgi:hypothetical protein